MIEGLVMGKSKREKASEPSNWVPGWFGKTLTAKPSPKHIRKHLEDRLFSAAQSTQKVSVDFLEKAESERRFGM
jgi:hypothetical protein